MFKKIPYGVKVRVRGNDATGYVAEYCLHYSRFVRFFNTWSIIKYHDPKRYTSTNVFPTLQLAQDAAMEQYNRWIGLYQRQEEEKRVAKAVKKSRTVWEHP